MNPSVTIVEVLGRSLQGMTLPFLGRGDDDRLYYLKGRYAGLHSLCCEWIAGNLARAMELPVPDFAIAEVPETLVAGSDRTDIGDLGAGLVFASARLGGAREITWPEAQDCTVQTQALVLLFDWWVQNEDRKLSALGGNPNLLMTANEKQPDKLWVFDFNLAFDADFSVARFREEHLFAALLKEWPPGFRASIEARMHAALNRLPEWFSSLPKKWQHIDADETLPAQLEQKLVFETLARAFNETDTFWNLL